jgi:hypothetical protein
MSRVKGVVGVAIMVNLRDVVAGDILHGDGTERDRIIERVETRDDGMIMLHYKDQNGRRPKNSIWMNPNPVHGYGNGCIFVHDLKRERFDWTPEVIESNQEES